ncbi:MAG: Ig-like domain-containing protein [Granulosicoccus sp.]
MLNKKAKKSSVLIILATALSASGCNWVDSAGNQGIPDSLIDIPVSDDALVALVNEQPVEIQEQSWLYARLDGFGMMVSNWTWEPAETTDSSCDLIAGFDQEIAESNLLDACSDPTRCDIRISEYEDGPVTHFAISLPALKAPARLDYVLNATTDDGISITRKQTLCAQSVNEAPDARDDSYTALPGRQLIVRADDPNNLLANDVDDNDSRNQPLTINPVPVVAPQYAEEFSLSSDGSFTYLANSKVVSNTDGSLEDYFVYALSDGLHTVNAEVTIRLNIFNRAPQIVSAPDEITLVVENDRPVAIAELDLTKLFVDPEGDSIDFSVDRTMVPDELSTVIDSEGVLTLTADAEVAGNWAIVLVASDGIASADHYLVVTVEAPEQIVTVEEPEEIENQPPTATDISNRVVQGSFTYDVSVFFDDPDNDILTFTQDGLPTGVSMSTQGVISGQRNSRNAGSWLVLVTARDEQGNSVSDAFRLQIR